MSATTAAWAVTAIASVGGLIIVTSLIAAIRIAREEADVNPADLEEARRWTEDTTW